MQAIREIREENDELQDEEQFEKSEEFENQGFEYGSPLDENPEPVYSERRPEAHAEAETRAESEEGRYKKGAVNAPNDGKRLHG